MQWATQWMNGTHNLNKVTVGCLQSHRVLYRWEQSAPQRLNSHLRLGVVTHEQLVDIDIGDVARVVIGHVEVVRQVIVLTNCRSENFAKGVIFSRNSEHTEAIFQTRLHPQTIGHSFTLQISTRDFFPRVCLGFVQVAFLTFQANFSHDIAGKATKNDRRETRKSA